MPRPKVFSVELPPEVAEQLEELFQLTTHKTKQQLFQALLFPAIQERLQAMKKAGMGSGKGEDPQSP